MQHFRKAQFFCLRIFENFANFCHFSPTTDRAPTTFRLLSTTGRGACTAARVAALAEFPFCYLRFEWSNFEKFQYAATIRMLQKTCGTIKTARRRAFSLKSMGKKATESAKYFSVKPIQSEFFMFKSLTLIFLGNNEPGAVGTTRWWPPGIALQKRRCKLSRSPFEKFHTTTNDFMSDDKTLISETIPCSTTQPSLDAY